MSLYTWGVGSHGRLGHGGNENVYGPRSIPGLTGTNVRSVASSTYHTIAATENGDVIIFGILVEFSLVHVSLKTIIFVF